MSEKTLHEIDEPIIWLQYEEEQAEAECGCRLIQNYAQSNAAFFQCAKHAAAPELLEACKLVLENLTPLYSSEHICMKSLHAAIAKAEAK